MIIYSKYVVPVSSRNRLVQTSVVPLDEYHQPPFLHSPKRDKGNVIYKTARIKITRARMPGELVEMTFGVNMLD